MGDPAVPHRVHIDARVHAIAGSWTPARAEHRVWEIDTGHDLMITEPERVTAALLEVAADPG